MLLARIGCTKEIKVQAAILSYHSILLNNSHISARPYPIRGEILNNAKIVINLELPCLAIYV
jgi:hypothetical protein